MADMVSSGIFVINLVVLSLFVIATAEVEEHKDHKEYVLTLDHSNFSNTVSMHDFIVIEFYAPWCGHCQRLAPEYEKAASILSNHDPPIVLAKVDANEESNRGLATEFEVQGFPTIKILRNGGKISQEFKGPREADGIVSYLIKQLAPASAEIRSGQDAATLIDEKKIFVVGIFPKLSGEEYENFTKLAVKLRSDYDFVHTQDAKHLPRGEVVNKPTLRLLKPFDELFVDSQDFQFDALEKFIEEVTIPIVTIFDGNPENYPYVSKFFDSPNAKAMLFLNFSTERNAFESKYRDVAAFYKGKGISFLIGDAEASENAFQYFGLAHGQAPLLIIQHNGGQKFLKPNIQPDQIAYWLKDYKEGKVKPYTRSQPIPEVNNELVKVVVFDSLQDMVLNSGKNVLLEFYAPWCGHCKKLAPILEEVAVSFENDADIVIAKFDATANDVPGETFDVQGYPTMYFRSAGGKLLRYKGERTKEDIIDFIQKHRDKPAEADSLPRDSIKSDDSVDPTEVKDEL